MKDEMLNRAGTYLILSGLLFSLGGLFGFALIRLGLAIRAGRAESPPLHAEDDADDYDCLAHLGHA